ncbi:MAG: hypothetical protein Ct9H300mP14_03400 [Gammaproteobacteria bacterium]|nr:MAG: hypothetical protein Ct9H300mP14_03400 [Gammaproteobacteria bacterium]
MTYDEQTLLETRVTVREHPISNSGYPGSWGRSCSMRRVDTVFNAAWNLVEQFPKTRHNPGRYSIDQLPVHQRTEILNLTDPKWARDPAIRSGDRTPQELQLPATKQKAG